VKPSDLEDRARWISGPCGHLQLHASWPAINCDKRRKALGVSSVSRFGTSKRDSESIEEREHVNRNIADGSLQ